MEEYTPDFNGSLATLIRIDELLRDCSYCRVNHQWIGWQNNLLQAYKEGFDWLTEKEQKEGRFLMTMCSKLDAEEQTVSINEKDILRLDDYEIKLRQRLKKQGLTFKAKDLTSREDRLRKNYGIQPKPRKQNNN